MPGRVATPGPKCWLVRHVGALLAGSLFAATAIVAAAQPPGTSDRDERSPRPLDEESRRGGARKYQIPNKDRAIFKGLRDARTGQYSGGIADFERVASELTNKLEYDAWHEVTLHAAQFSSRELEEHASREATRDELTGKDRAIYRLELLRFDGKLIKVRRFPAAKSLRESGTLEMYEAVLLPLDEPPTGTIAVDFTELPLELAAVRQSPENEWLPVDRWAIAAGFFFKVVQDASGAEAKPVLIGRSIRLLTEPPAGPDPKNPAAIDKALSVFRHIRNDAPSASGDENWEERVAWNRVLLHAHRFSAEELEEHARTDLTFFDLFSDGRWVDKDGRDHYNGKRDYKLELVRFEGRLVRLQKMAPPRELRDAGIETAYEGWLTPRGEPNPICIVFTEPIDGVEPGGRINKWVSFAGYVFKLLRYESGEKDRDDPNRHTWKRAPLLLGRGVIARPDPDGASQVSWGSFVTVATSVVLGILAAALGLTWWFRQGDRTARREIEANRTRNPFDGING
jgi:hypothetical protein